MGTGAWWWHLSSTWTGKKIEVRPRAGRVDDFSDIRDTKPCICVAPSLLQALVAIGAWGDSGASVTAWVTQGTPREADWVFDFGVTGERRFYVKRTFTFVREVPVAAMAHLQAGDVGCPEALALSLRRLRDAFPDLAGISGPPAASRAPTGRRKVWTAIRH